MASPPEEGGENRGRGGRASVSDQSEIILREILEIKKSQHESALTQSAQNVHLGHLTEEMRTMKGHVEKLYEADSDQREKLGRQDERLTSVARTSGGIWGSIGGFLGGLVSGFFGGGMR